MVNIRYTPQQPNDLVDTLRAGGMGTVVAASVTYDQLFGSAGEQELARAWAEDLGFPLTWDSISRVAQHHYFHTGDDTRVKSDFLLFLKRVLLGQAQSDPSVAPDIMKELISSIHKRTFTEIAEELGFPKIEDPSRDPLLLLANLPVPIYVTTSFHGFLQRFLRTAGKAPRTAICRWNEGRDDLTRSEHRLDPDYRPTPKTPLVFHLFGYEEYPESLALSEDNYLSLLQSISQNRGRDARDPVIPLVVLGTWATSSQYYLGFRPDSLEFKTLWMGLPSALRQGNRSMYRGIFQYLLPTLQTIGSFHVQYLSDRNLDVPEGDVYELLSPLRRSVIETLAFEPETILVPAGPFMMGNDDPTAPPWDQPQHHVSLPDFRIGKYPVTNRQYAAFVKDKKDYPPPQGWFNREPPPILLDHPVTSMTWHDALAYCAWLSARTGRRFTLPSEAEWEKAASWKVTGERGRWLAGIEDNRAESDRNRRYPWGNEWIEERCNANGSGTTEVTAHPDGASAYGVEDLLGNVQEWTRSLWGSQVTPPKFGYPYDPSDGREVTDPSKLPAQARLVHRGGSFKSAPAELRCSARGNSLPESKIAWRGFRVVMEIE